MSNHVHILSVPRKQESLSKGIGGTNLVYTQYINRKYNQSGRLWQNRFFSTVIDQESYLWAAARYIERNPVRAKLEEKAEDYPWSSARAHVLGTKDKVLSDNGWLQIGEREVYGEFLKHEEAELEASLRTATSTGRPFGRETFITIIEKILQRKILRGRGGRPKKE
jgi:putative transposase